MPNGEYGTCRVPALFVSDSEWKAIEEAVRKTPAGNIRRGCGNLIRIIRAFEETGNSRMTLKAMKEIAGPRFKPEIINQMLRVHKLPWTLARCELSDSILGTLAQDREWQFSIPRP